MEVNSANMDPTEFCFEVPIINAENIEDLRNTVSLNFVSNKEVVTKSNNTITNSASIEEYGAWKTNCNSKHVQEKNKQFNNIVANCCDDPMSVNKDKNENKEITDVTNKMYNTPMAVNVHACMESIDLTANSNECMPLVIENTNRALVGTAGKSHTKCAPFIHKAQQKTSNNEKWHNESTPIIIEDATKQSTDTPFSAHSTSTINKDALKSNPDTPMCASETKDPDEPTVIIDDEGMNNQLTKLGDKCLVKPVATNEETNKRLLALAGKCLGESSPVINKDVNVEDYVEVKDNTIKNHTKRNPIIDKGNDNPTENNIDESTSVVIDDNSEKDNDCTIIDNENMVSQKNNSKSKYKDVNCFDELYKDNRIFTDLIEKCLDMENSTGMLRVINRTLIPMYNDAAEVFKNSSLFQRVLSHTIMKIETVPDKKFSHIKNLSEWLKMNKEKRRASFVTLSSEVNGTISKNRSKFSPDANHHSQPQRKRKKVDVIDLDDDDDETHVIFKNSTDLQIKITDVRGHVTDDDVSSIQHKANTHEAPVEIEDTGSDSDIEINKQNDVTQYKDQDDDIILVDDVESCNKENEAISKQRNKALISEPVSNTLLANNKPIENLNNNKVTEIDLSNEPDEINSNKVVNPEEPPKNNVQQQIEHFELEIASLNKRILELDEKEVIDTDDLNSPYIQSEMCKSRVVHIYKELCKLTGMESVKRRKVRLKVVEGHPKGPVKCLEEYINNNIDVDGNPPFPDMYDVINCVNKANVMHNMGWSKKQIEQEARALFIQYGRTVQKKRMKREWRHLMSYVKDEAPDPADEDLTLQARLQLNSQIAKKNEEELLERFAQMENPSLHNTGLRLSVDGDSSEQETNNESTCPTPSASNVASEPIATNVPNSGNAILNTYDGINNSNLTSNIVVYSPWALPVQYAMEMAVVGNVNNAPPVLYCSIIPPTPLQSTGLTQLLHNNPETSKSSTSNTVVQSNLEVSSNNEVTTSDVATDGITTNLEARENTNNVEVETDKSEVVSNSEVLNSNAEDSVNATRCDEVTKNSEVAVNKACELESTDAGLTHSGVNTLVKSEPLDIPRMLEQLGDKFTTTIIDIEDPFLVVEISDSSESEDERME